VNATCELVHDYASACTDMIGCSFLAVMFRTCVHAM